jgi:hypothetical protein
MPRPVLNLTPEQRKAALEKASEAKAAKKQLLDDLRSGKIGPADLLSDDAKSDDRIQKLQVVTMLRAVPGINPAKVRGILDDLGIDEGRRIQGLGVRQHAALKDFLGG